MRARALRAAGAAGLLGTALLAGCGGGSGNSSGRTLTVEYWTNNDIPGTNATPKLIRAAAAELAKQQNIDEVVFNRNGFLYHGRVKALAEAAREAGLRF